MKYGSGIRELADCPTESRARCLGWHPIQEPSNPNTGGLFTGHYPCDWQGSQPLRGLHMKDDLFVRARSLSLRVMIRRLIDVTVKAFHKVSAVKQSIMTSFHADYFSFSTVILSFYSSIIKVQFDIGARRCRLRLELNLWSSIGLWLLRLYDSRYVSTAPDKGLRWT